MVRRTKFWPRNRVVSFGNIVHKVTARRYATICKVGNPWLTFKRGVIRLSDREIVLFVFEIFFVQCGFRLPNLFYEGITATVTPRALPSRPCACNARYLSVSIYLCFYVSIYLSMSRASWVYLPSDSQKFGTVGIVVVSSCALAGRSTIVTFSTFSLGEKVTFSLIGKS